MVWSFSGTTLLLRSSLTITLLLVAYQQQTAISACHANKGPLQLSPPPEQMGTTLLKQRCQERAGDCGTPSHTHRSSRFSGHSQTLQVIWTTSTFNETRRNKCMTWRKRRVTSSRFKWVTYKQKLLLQDFNVNSVFIKHWANHVFLLLFFHYKQDFIWKKSSTFSHSQKRVLIQASTETCSADHLRPIKWLCKYNSTFCSTTLVGFSWIQRAR